MATLNLEELSDQQALALLEDKARVSLLTAVQKAKLIERISFETDTYSTTAPSSDEWEDEKIYAARVFDIKPLSDKLLRKYALTLFSALEEKKYHIAADCISVLACHLRDPVPQEGVSPYFLLSGIGNFSVMDPVATQLGETSVDATSTAYDDWTSKLGSDETPNSQNLGTLSAVCMFLTKVCVKQNETMTAKLDSQESASSIITKIVTYYRKRSTDLPSSLIMGDADYSGIKTYFDLGTVHLNSCLCRILAFQYTHKDTLSSFKQQTGLYNFLLLQAVEYNGMKILNYVAQNAKKTRLPVNIYMRKCAFSGGIDGIITVLQWMKKWASKGSVSVVAPWARAIDNNYFSDLSVKNLEYFYAQQVIMHAKLFNRPSIYESPSLVPIKNIIREMKSMVEVFATGLIMKDALGIVDPTNKSEFEDIVSKYQAEQKKSVAKNAARNFNPASRNEEEEGEQDADDWGWNYDPNQDGYMDTGNPTAGGVAEVDM